MLEAKQFSPNDDSDTDRSISSSSNSSSSTSSTDSNDMDALDPSNLESNFDQVNYNQQTTTTTEEVFPNWKHKTIFWGEVKELMDAFEARFAGMYNPGQKLSLDESLIRAFGRIKFKVRIISKSARYGIKMYVITDSTTAFVLRVIVYTGSATYNFNPDKDIKKQ